LFHLIAKLFGLEATVRERAPAEKIRQLRDQGFTLTEIKELTGATMSAIRGLVGRLDRASIRQRQEEIASKIDIEAIPWCEKVRRWKAETSQSEATFRRVRNRATQ
jgi:hypothetical protein